MSVSRLPRFTVSMIADWVGGLKRRIGHPHPAAHRADSAARFHCVSIRPCAVGCETALELEGRRFLPSEAPPVPLVGCSRGPGAERTCTYHHHSDRRFHDRRSGFGCDAEPLFDTGVERRACPGRRRSDYDDDRIVPLR